MKILVITKLYGQPDDAGADKPTLTVNYFVREWQAMGHQVAVMHTSSRFPLALYLLPESIKNRYAGKFSTNVPVKSSRKKLIREDGGAKVYRLPMLKLVPKTGYSAHAMQHMQKTIQDLLQKLDFRPDVILGHFANPATELTARLAKYYGVPSSIVFHQDAFEANIQKYRLGHWVPMIGAVGARSIAEARELKQSLSLPELPFVCYSGVPEDAVRAVANAPVDMDFSHGIRYLHVGSFIKRKHLDAVIRAFAATAQPEDSLRIVGEGIESESYHRLAQEVDPNGQINFVGLISRPEVLAEMKKAQVFTLISRDEAFGMVYIEAMLQGCIVVATRRGAFDGIIRDGVNGFLCDAGDEAMLAEVWKRIATLTVQQREDIARRAVETAMNFSEKAVAERYLRDALAHQAKGSKESFP